MPLIHNRAMDVETVQEEGAAPVPEPPGPFWPLNQLRWQKLAQIRNLHKKGLHFIFY
jgi:hypothetical protein